MTEGTHKRLDQGRSPALLPFPLRLDLTIYDAATIAELERFEDPEERDQFAGDALRIGVMALRHARGQAQADAVRSEGERLLLGMQSRLEKHSEIIHERLTGILADYFDPQSGRLPERIDRLVSRDGELEGMLRDLVGSEDSELCRTLSGHFGADSPLMKTLDPDQSRGLMATLREVLDGQLKAQSLQVLSQFSLDNKDGALSRFIDELTERQTRQSGRLEDRLDEVVREFSLDQEDSALSRLVRNVEKAQTTITSEFSLDQEQSALSRLRKLLEETNANVSQQLSLDDEDSPLSRLRREMLRLLGEQHETNRRFQEEVKVAIESLAARRREARRSTQHGLEFEDAVLQFVEREVRGSDDIVTGTGSTTGRIRNCKVGDITLELGPESAAPEAVVVIEAKEKAGYVLRTARDEIETARKNRGAEVGLFVCSRETAPESFETFGRFGNDVFVVWDAEDATSDVYLRAGLSLARALCIRSSHETRATAEDLVEIDRAILEIEKRTGGLEEIEKWAGSIHKSAERIIEKVGVSRRALERQVTALREKMAGQS